MREIKFRAWDKSFKIMSEPFYDAWYQAQDLVFPISRLLEHPETFELMQYTGLKDKNGKEEYHFDITRNRYGAIRCIDWHCGAWWLKFADGKPDKPLFGSHASQEVIGNIYENPEMLEAGK